MAEPLQPRLARLADAAEVARLSTQLGYPAAEADLRRRLAIVLASPAHVMFVAGRDVTLVGWVAAEVRYTVESEPRVEITGLVVDSATRRSGTGRLLVKAVQRWAGARGHRVTLVRSNVARAESHPFYERLGYRRSKTQHVYQSGVDDS